MRLRRIVSRDVKLTSMPHRRIGADWHGRNCAPALLRHHSVSAILVHWMTRSCDNSKN